MKKIIYKIIDFFTLKQNRFLENWIVDSLLTAYLTRQDYIVYNFLSSDLHLDNQL